MDLFGRKRIRKLKETLLKTIDQYRILQADWEACINTIRNMDEQIFKMSQCTSWEQMRPNFNELADGMMYRKRVESNRIGSIVCKKIIDTYKPDYPLKIVGDK